jgi:hypothetical protein
MEGERERERERGGENDPLKKRQIVKDVIHVCVRERERKRERNKVGESWR